MWGIDPAAYESFKKRERRGDQLSKSQPVRHCSPRDDGPGVGAGGGAGQGFQLRERVLGISLPLLAA